MTDSSAPRWQHPDEVPTDTNLVQRLLAAQFPQWADLPVRRVLPEGTDNAIFQLGDDLSVRMPRVLWATDQLAKEARWLPHLAPFLPLAVPSVLAQGEPGEGYPWTWGVYTWLDGHNATPERLTDPKQAAVDLAQFIRALQSIDPTGGPIPDPLKFNRGIPLALRDTFTREHIARLPDDIDAAAVTSAWEWAVKAPVWGSAPVWVHADLQSGNLLASSGRLSAVIDFGGLQTGDPACEWAVAWKMFDAEARQTFRAAAGCDDATWTRAMGWALSTAVVEAAHYLHTHPGMVALARRTIAEVLADAALEMK